jgi:lipoprotein NlpD
MDEEADFWRSGSRWICVLFLSGIVGCAQQGKPLIVDKTTGDPGRAKHRVTVESGDSRSGRSTSSASYVVGRGDTLYSIAWRNGTTVEALAAINRLHRPYTIYPGQRLRLTTSGQRKSQPAQVSPNERASTPPAGVGSLVWRWPVADRPVREFGKGNKGLDFDLRTGTLVSAAADGEVVYAGAGLGGYESLTIIRHVNGFLSAYSLNGPIQHKEGDKVGRGDKVAEIVASGRLTRFHFEIRKDGDPVSPRLLLD